MPGSAGTLALNTRFMQRQGAATGEAIAASPIEVLSHTIVQILLVVCLLPFVRIPPHAITISGTRTPGSSGDQCHERLVLDLLEPADRDASGRVAIGERPPAPRDPLRVLGVPAQDSCPAATSRPMNLRRLTTSPTRMAKARPRRQTNAVRHSGSAQPRTAMTFLATRASWAGA